MDEITKLISPILVSLLAASIAAPLVFALLRKMQAQQKISEHLQEHAHKQGTPNMGGLIVLIGTIAGLLVQPDSSKAGITILLGFGIIGFLDDYIIPRKFPQSRGLGWIPKLAMQLLVSLPVIYTWMSRELIPIGLCLFIILFLSNAYNFSDGLDTLAGGLGVILAGGLASLSFVLISYGVYAGTVPLLCACLASAMIPFLFLNAPPAKVFMGDVGALPIGAYLGWCVCSLLAQPLGAYHPTMADSALNMSISQQNSLLLIAGIAAMLLIMVVEIVPVPLQIFWVKAFKKRLFNFKTPIHHAFQEKGWPETRITWTFHLAQSILVMLGLSIVIMGWQS